MNILGFFQRLGRALQLPIAVLPVAALLLRFGQPDLLNVPFIAQAGGAIFDNLALIFAIGVASSWSKDSAGAAALAGAVGYFILTKAMVTINPEINMGVLAGIITGLVGGAVYNRWAGIKLPDFLSFFGGKRFVPIITSVSSLVIGVIFSFVWPLIQNGINAASSLIADSTVGLFFYATIYRLLIPFGLHHIFYTPFYFMMGEYTDPSTGNTVTGDLTRFFAGDPTAGRFMMGDFPYMIFCLPAVALAIIHTARPEKKKMISGVMISAALTSMLTGITEPVEFSFLFVAPVLYLINSILAGVIFVVCDLFHVRHGYTFSGGGIDYVLNYGLSTNGWVVIPVGIVFAFIYYYLFRFAILKWNLKTPGRETDEDGQNEEKAPVAKDQLAFHVLQALGGQQNIANLDACITRLRVTVHQPSQVSKDELKRLGAVGVLEINNNFQAIFGTKSDALKDDIKTIMAGGVPATAATLDTVTDKPQKPDSGETFIYPIKGETVSLGDVPDQVFSEKMMGEGFAIIPSEGKVVAPADGEIVSIGFMSAGGTEILIHVGVDTVKLNGEGFEAHVTSGQAVKQGELLLTFDLDYIKQHAASAITPVIFTNTSEEDLKHIQMK